MTILVGDVGGTSIRMGLVDDPCQSGHPRSVQEYRTASFASLTAVVDAYLQQHDVAPTAGAFAVAAPTDGQTTLLTNANWSADVSELPFPATLLNDLEASGWAVLSKDFQHTNLIECHSPPTGVPVNMVIGLGTGFGSALIVPQSQLVLPMELGHVSFAPGTMHQAVLLQRWLTSNPRTTVEDVLSGRGLWTLTNWVAQEQGVAIPSKWVRERDMIGRLLQDNLMHPIAVAVWDLFVSILGSVCGDLIVAHRLHRIVLSGGVLQKIRPILTEERRLTLFKTALYHKSPMTHLVEQAQIDISTVQWMNLVGVAMWYAVR